MRRYLMLTALVLLAAPAGAQPNRQALQQRVMERLIQNFQAEAGLSEDQAAEFRQVMLTSFRAQRQLEARHRQLLQAIQGQLRPGVAADQDSVVALLDGIRANRRAVLAQQEESEAAVAALLTPVQQAQLLLQLERFRQQVEAIIRRRNQEAGNRPGF